MAQDQGQKEERQVQVNYYLAINQSMFISEFKITSMYILKCFDKSFLVERDFMETSKMKLESSA